MWWLTDIRDKTDYYTPSMSTKYVDKVLWFLMHSYFPIFSKEIGWMYTELFVSMCKLSVKLSNKLPTKKKSFP